MADDPPISKTQRYKKITKPLLERKRRARINACLEELKEIMTSALQAEGENVSKLEKADILELTVRHLHKLNQTQRLALRSPMEEMQKFQAGYSSCAQEATNFLLATPGLDMRVGHRLISHLFNPGVVAAGPIPPLSSSQPVNQQPAQSASASHTNSCAARLQQAPVISNIITNTSTSSPSFADVKPPVIPAALMAAVSSAAASIPPPFIFAGTPDVKPDLAQLVTSSLQQQRSGMINTLIANNMNTSSGNNNFVKDRLVDVKPNITDISKMKPVRPSAVRPGVDPLASRSASMAMWKPYS